MPPAYRFSAFPNADKNFESRRLVRHLNPQLYRVPVFDIEPSHCNTPVNRRLRSLTAHISNAQMSASEHILLYHRASIAKPPRTSTAPSYPSIGRYVAAAPGTTNVDEEEAAALADPLADPLAELPLMVPVVAVALFGMTPELLAPLPPLVA